MANISSKKRVSEREIFYFRHRYRNRVHQAVISYFAAQAEKSGITKADLATSLDKDPAQITRWLAGPGNWTLDTVSDLLLAMRAEMSDSIFSFDEPVTATSSISEGPGIVVYENTTGNELTATRTTDLAAFVPARQHG